MFCLGAQDTLATDDQFDRSTVGAARPSYQSQRGNDRGGPPPKLSIHHSLALQKVVGVQILLYLIHTVAKRFDGFAWQSTREHAIKCALLCCAVKCCAVLCFSVLRCVFGGGVG